MAQNNKYINIEFPFKESSKGFFLELNQTDSKAVRSDLMHLILTRKGERLYNPDFGTDLLRFIFEPNDSLTYSAIKFDIQSVVKKYIPNLEVNDITIEMDETNEYRALIRIDYTITEDVFKETDYIVITL